MVVMMSSVATAGLAACGGSASGSPSANAGVQQLQIVDRDYSYELSSQSVSPGWTRLVMQNKGGEEHQAQLVKPKSGVTSDQFVAQLRQDGGQGPSLGMVDFAGGPNSVAPGATSVAYTDLAPGDYVLLCFDSTADGTPHFEKGMVQKLHVTTTSAGPAQAPASTATIGLKDFSFTFPSGFNGHGTYQVNNAGPQPHEMGLLKLNPGVTPDQVKAMILAPPGSPAPSGPPPFTPVGGLGAIDPGMTAYVTLDLSPGTYMALCFVPDVHTHQPHAAEGMITSFTIK